MILRRIAPFLLSFFLIASLYLKFSIEHPLNYDEMDQIILKTATSSLTQAGFMNVTAGAPSPLAFVKGACLLWVATARPQGGQDDSFRLQFKEIATTKYWYKGRLINERPTATPMVDRVLEKLNQVLGRNVRLIPLYMIAFAPTCTPEDLHTIDLPEYVS